MKHISFFSGIIIVLGAYICSSGTGIIRWIGAGVILAGIIVLLLSILDFKRREKQIRELNDQIIDFLDGRVQTPRFSVDDNMFSLLENAVIELESSLLLERYNTLDTSQKNADFIADVSHQLKTPLAALKLYCEMDSADYPRAHGEKQLQLIEHMEQLIYSLLRLEKLRADAYEMKFARQDLSQLIQQVWEKLQPMYTGKSFNISGNASLRCDASWLGEALLNVLKNSCEHTQDDGKITVFIDPSEASVTITIQDNGGGILNEQLPGLFHRFSRSHRASPKGGVGIGLAITKTIVEKHHGTIYAENTSEGLKIIMCIPILDGILIVS
ncbi:MAG: hypothetical protein GX815_14260 [Clostridiales bacterium]|nr:hypothetical protein [Clostridiales bacterium]